MCRESVAPSNHHRTRSTPCQDRTSAIAHKCTRPHHVAHRGQSLDRQHEMYSSWKSKCLTCWLSRAVQWVVWVVGVYSIFVYCVCAYNIFARPQKTRPQINNKHTTQYIYLYIVYMYIHIYNIWTEFGWNYIRCQRNPMTNLHQWGSFACLILWSYTKTV